MAGATPRPDTVAGLTGRAQPAGNRLPEVSGGAVIEFFMPAIGGTVIPETRRASIRSPMGNRDAGAASQSRSHGSMRLSDW